jgi:hypothetical protein
MAEAICRRSRTFQALAAASMGLLLTACVVVGPARSFGVYEGKAGATAQDMVSAVQSARLTVTAASDRKAFGAYLSQLFTDAEGDAMSVQGAFDSIQPPDQRSDALRGQLDDLLANAVSILSELRIAARSGDFGKLPEIARPLRRLAGRLQSFAQNHQ